MKPLTGAYITKASKITLWVYPLLSIFVGSNYISTLIHHEPFTPAISVANAIVPLPAWGAFFVSVGVWLMYWRVFGDAQNARLYYTLGLVILCSILGIWSLIFLGAAIWSTATYSAFAYPFALSILGVASIFTVDSEEQGD